MSDSEKSRPPIDLSAQMDDVRALLREILEYQKDILACLQEQAKEQAKSDAAALFES